MSLGAFEALTLHAAGRVGATLGRLLTPLVDHVDSEDLDRYKPALREPRVPASLEPAPSREPQ